MSKFNELRSTFEQYASAERRYERECGDFVFALRRNLVAYMGCEIEDIKIVAFNDDLIDKDLPADFEKFSITKRMLLGKDGFWHFTLTLMFGSQWAKLFLSIAKRDEIYILKFGSQEYQGSREEMDDIVGSLFESIHKLFLAALKNASLGIQDFLIEEDKIEPPSLEKPPIAFKVSDDRVI